MWISGENWSTYPSLKLAESRHPIRPSRREVTQPRSKRGQVYPVIGVQGGQECFRRTKGSSAEFLATPNPRSNSLKHRLAVQSRVQHFGAAALRISSLNKLRYTSLPSGPRWSVQNFQKGWWRSPRRR